MSLHAYSYDYSLSGYYGNRLFLIWRICLYKIFEGDKRKFIMFNQLTSCGE